LWDSEEVDLSTEQGMWVGMPIASFSLLFYRGLCDGANADIEIEGVAISQGWI
jgi:hypothetical protein